MMKNLRPSNFVNAIFELVKLVTHFHSILFAVQVKKVSSCNNEEMSNNSDKVGGVNSSFSILNSQLSTLNSSATADRSFAILNSQLKNPSRALTLNHRSVYVRWWGLGAEPWCL